MKEADETTPLMAGGLFSTGALVISVVGILIIGLYPTPLFEASARAAQTLFFNR